MFSAAERDLRPDDPEGADGAAAARKRLKKVMTKEQIAAARQLLGGLGTRQLPSNAKRWVRASYRTAPTLYQSDARQGRPCACSGDM